MARKRIIGQGTIFQVITEHALFVGSNVYILVITCNASNRIGHTRATCCLSIEMAKRISHRIIDPHTNISAHPNVATTVFKERCHNITLQTVFVVMGTIYFERGTIKTVQALLGS